MPMLDVSYLYDPIRNRYKGVYPNRNPDYWDAILFSPDGQLARRGTFSSQEGAAQAVAAYYQSVYGDDWVTALKDRRRRYWRIRKIRRSSSLSIFLAEIRTPGTKTYKRVSNTDIPYIKQDWSEIGEGWISTAAALVAIRIYRFMNQQSSTVPSS